MGSCLSGAVWKISEYNEIQRYERIGAEIFLQASQEARHKDFFAFSIAASRYGLSARLHGEVVWQFRLSSCTRTFPIYIESGIRSRCVAQYCILHMCYRYLYGLFQDPCQIGVFPCWSLLIFLFGCRRRTALTWDVMFPGAWNLCFTAHLKLCVGHYRLCQSSHEFLACMIIVYYSPPSRSDALPSVRKTAYMEERNHQLKRQRRSRHFGLSPSCNVVEPVLDFCQLLVGDPLLYHLTRFYSPLTIVLNVLYYIGVYQTYSSRLQTRSPVPFE